MKFVISATELHHHLSIAYGAIVRNPIMSILENFLFSVEGDTLRVIGSSIDVTIFTSTKELDIESGGRIAVRANILLDLLKEMPDQPIECIVEEDSEQILTIHSSQGVYQVPIEDPDDFPNVELPENMDRTHVSNDILVDAIEKTIFAASNDEMRLNLSGIFFDMKEGEFKIVATDAHKLVRYEIQEYDHQLDKEALIPKKSVRLLKSLLNNSDQCSFTFDNQSAYFFIGETIFVSRLIVEKFPNYNNAIPSNVHSYLVIERLALISALRRTANFANRTTQQINLDLQDDSLKITARDLDYNSEAVETLYCEYPYPDLFQIAFNGQFMLEILQSQNSEKIRFEFSSDRTGALVYPDALGEDRSILSLIMPVAYR